MGAQTLPPCGNHPRCPRPYDCPLFADLLYGAPLVFPYSTHLRTEPLGLRKGRDTFPISFAGRGVFHDLQNKSENYHGGDVLLTCRFALNPCAGREPARPRSHKASQRGEPIATGGRRNGQVHKQGFRGVRDVPHPQRLRDHRAHLEGQRRGGPGGHHRQGRQRHRLRNRQEPQGFPESTATREELEAFAIDWLSSNETECVDCPVRFDAIALILVSPDRAMIRHHINAMSAGCDIDSEEE